MFGDYYRGKRVFVTGHTGFKGAWLAEWLGLLGAEITGFSDGVSPGPSLFAGLGLERRLRHLQGDVRNADAVEVAVRDCRPQLVFHLAAQPLVRLSYREPVRTFAANVMGTVHVLEALRTLERPVAAVFVTSDKCYENREWLHSYREEDRLGGYDPYSASKGASELAVAAWRRSFFSSRTERPSLAAIASARAGNVIGGGDWALDRIVPDSMRSLMQGQPILVRSRHATRPWQHVLEPLGGYLWLGALLGGAVEGRADARRFPPGGARSSFVPPIISVLGWNPTNPWKPWFRRCYATGPAHGRTPLIQPRRTRHHCST